MDKFKYSSNELLINTSGSIDTNKTTNNISETSKTFDPLTLIKENTEENKEEEEVTVKEFVENLIPNISSELIYVMIQIIETHFIGQTENNELYDAIGLAQSYNLILLFFVGDGIIDVMDTICSRCFGKKNFYLLGVQTNQVRLIVTIYTSVISLLNYIFGYQILCLFVGKEDYVGDAHLYVMIVTPSIIISLHYEIYCRYFETQLVYKPVIISLIAALIVHPIICWIIIQKFEMGIVGAAICSCITESIRFIIIFVYAGCCNPYPESHISFNRDIFKKFGTIFKLSAASAALFFGESAGYNMVEFITARLGVTQFAQHLALINITMISFALSGGFINTNAILIGNYAAKNSPSNVRRLIKISLVASLIVFIPIFGLIAIFPLSMLEYFAESEDVWRSNGMVQMVYLMCICNFFDFQQSNLQGYLRGLGVLNITFIVSFIAYCLILPFLSYFLAYNLNWKLKGIWTSMLFINLIVLIINYLILANSNIPKLCEEYEEEGGNLNNSKEIEEGEDIISSKKIKQIKEN